MAGLGCGWKLKRFGTLTAAIGLIGDPLPADRCRTCRSSAQERRRRSAGLPLSIVAAGEKSGQIAVVEQADAEFRLEQQVAVIVEMDAPSMRRPGAGVADEALAFAAEHPRGVGEVDENPLRAVLQEPAA